MININFESSEGKAFPLSAEAGTSAMRAAKDNEIPGILAYCGGNAECGTCHVYVSEEFEGELSAMSDAEDATLETVAAERKGNSRLSCQITLEEQINGIKLSIPDRQE